MKYNFNFSCLTKHIFSGVAYMYVCILEHPHHFGKKKQHKTNKQIKRRKRQRTLHLVDMMIC
jgi:hypothetical protein